MAKNSLMQMEGIEAFPHWVHRRGEDGKYITKGWNKEFESVLVNDEDELEKLHANWYPKASVGKAKVVDLQPAQSTPQAWAAPSDKKNN